MEKVFAVGMPLAWAKGSMKWRIGRKPAPKTVAVKENAVQIAGR